jgi:hypothetical protein
MLDQIGCSQDRAQPSVHSRERVSSEVQWWEMASRHPLLIGILRRLLQVDRKRTSRAVQAPAISS